MIGTKYFLQLTFVPGKGQGAIADGVYYRQLDAISVSSQNQFLADVYINWGSIEIYIDVVKRCTSLKYIHILV